MNMLYIMVQTYTLRVVQGTQSWMEKMGIELDSEGNDMMRTALEVQRHLKTTGCLMEPAQLTCLLLMGGTVQGLTRALQRLGPLVSKVRLVTGGPGLLALEGVVLQRLIVSQWRQRPGFNGLLTLYVNCHPLSWVS